MDWLWGIIMLVFSGLFTLNTSSSFFVHKSIKNTIKLESVKANHVADRYLIIGIVNLFLLVILLICFFAIPYFEQFSGTTIPCACVGIGLGLITSATTKASSATDVIEKEQLLEKELEYTTQGMSPLQKKDFEDAVVNELYKEDNNIPQNIKNKVTLTIDNYEEYLQFDIIKMMDFAIGVKPITLIENTIIEYEAKIVLKLTIKIYQTYKKEEEPIVISQKIKFNTDNNNHIKLIDNFLELFTKEYNPKYIKIDEIELLEVENINGIIYEIDDCINIDEYEYKNQSTKKCDNCGAIYLSGMGECPHCQQEYLTITSDEKSIVCVNCNNIYDIKLNHCPFCHIGNPKYAENNNINNEEQIVDECELIECPNCQTLVVSTEEVCPNCNNKLLGEKDD